MPHFTPEQKQRLLAGIGWFKQQFGNEIQQAVQSLPFHLDFLTAIAIQETYEVWGRARQVMNKAEVLMACVGDTLDAVDGRDSDAFPRDRAELESVPNGPQMFQIARQALMTLTQVAPEYQKRLKNPDKFCHAFGIFQYDMQFFETDSAYFLHRRWGDFSLCLGKCLNELTKKKNKWYPNTNTLSDTELVYIAIAYNHGFVDIHGDFNQGHQDSDDVYYGQYIATYIDLAKHAPTSHVEPDWRSRTRP
jgi:hypothetical protein